MSELQSSNDRLCEMLGITMDTLSARHLLNEGVTSYLAGNYDSAERDFEVSQRLATACNTTRNTARIYRAIVLYSRHWPGKMRIPEEAEANDKLIVDARELYQQVLADSPNKDQREAAEQGLHYLNPIC